jgi:transposase, IS5 family
MRRNHLKCRNGDRINAVLPAGYNFRLLSRWFKEFLHVLLLIPYPGVSPLRFA